MLAKHDGLRSVCGRFIVGGRSRIDPLSMPLLPAADERISDKPHRDRTYGDHRSHRGHPRLWAHEWCVERFKSEVALQRLHQHQKQETARA
jgi:hypothetical protein